MIVKCCWDILLFYLIKVLLLVVKDQNASFTAANDKRETDIFGGLFQEKVIWFSLNNKHVTRAKLSLLFSSRWFAPSASAPLLCALANKAFKPLLCSTDHSSQDSVWETLTDALLTGTTCQKTEGTSASSGALSAEWVWLHGWSGVRTIQTLCLSKSTTVWKYSTTNKSTALKTLKYLSIIRKVYKY